MGLPVGLRWQPDIYVTNRYLFFHAGTLYSKYLNGYDDGAYFLLHLTACTLMERIIPHSLLVLSGHFHIVYSFL